MADSTPTEGTDRVFELPLLREVTYDEVHSALLGLVGVLAGAGFRLGYDEAVAVFTICVVFAAFGLRRVSGDRVPTAVGVIRREPWYFLTIYVSTAVGTTLVWTMVA